MVSTAKTKFSNCWNYFEKNGQTSELVNLPHTNKLMPYNYFDEKDYQFISRYEKKLTLNDMNKRVFLQFDGVMTAFTLTVNGHDFPECRGGYIEHCVEITDYVKLGENDISVLVDSTERTDIPPFGYVVDYLTFGGIYRDVFLCETEKNLIKNAFLPYTLSQMNKKTADATIIPTLEIDAKVCGISTVCIEICGAKFTQDITLIEGVSQYELNPFTVANVNLWSINSPNLYEAKISLIGENSQDNAAVTVGFRDIKIESGSFLLNGEKVKLMGLNRHQSYPYVGYAMPKRAQEADAKTLKNIGLNAVRTSHYPQSPYFLDECDRQGLLVLEEIPGWQHISSESAWREQALCNVKGMVERDYNHPAIFTWGVRINESWDDHDLYEKTNALARSIDKTRKTCGIRCMDKSEFLEDIYTMNDFIHHGDSNVLRHQKNVTGKEEMVPYIVTEFCGHIYPTKRFDQEERLIEHALRHGRVQSRSAQEDEFLGAFGWCAFDYNTHFDFGSGDRICYHGVMDMFRMEKFAAAVYKSQREKSAGYVLEPLTYWARGERNLGEMFPIRVFTNCDEIEILLDGKSAYHATRQAYNVDDEMLYLKNPPFVISLNLGEWGAHLVNAEFIGLENGKEVCKKAFLAAPTYDHIVAEIDDSAILANEYDCTRVVVKAVDKASNSLPYLNEVLEISVTGDIEVIGPSVTSFCGGQAAFWVRSKVLAQKGAATISIKTTSGFNADLTLALI